jgi:hypothetical protein
LRKPALAHGAIYTVDKPVALFVLEGLGRNEVIEIEDLVMEPIQVLTLNSRYETGRARARLQGILATARLYHKFSRRDIQNLPLLWLASEMRIRVA